MLPFTRKASPKDSSSFTVLLRILHPGLLPSYLERSGSSLVYMMDHLIRRSGHPDSGFYLDNLDELVPILQKRNEDEQPTLLVGVSFALLDLAEQYPMKLEDHIIVMETGGMKGRRKELIRSELHSMLRKVLVSEPFTPNTE